MIGAIRRNTSLKRGNALRFFVSKGKIKKQTWLWRGKKTRNEPAVCHSHCFHSHIKLLISLFLTDNLFPPSGFWAATWEVWGHAVRSSLATHECTVCAVLLFQRGFDCKSFELNALAERVHTGWQRNPLARFIFGISLLSSGWSFSSPCPFA